MSSYNTNRNYLENVMNRSPTDICVSVASKNRGESLGTEKLQKRSASIRKEEEAVAYTFSRATAEMEEEEDAQL